MPMTDQTQAAGRPGVGEVLAAQMAQDAAARPRSRDLSPLRHLVPFVMAHKLDTGLATFFLLISTGASLGLTGAVRLLFDHGFAVGTAEALNRYFLIFAAVAAGLATATASVFVGW